MPNLVNSSKGFTLIELLVVMAIFASLSIFVFVNYKNTSPGRSLEKGVSDIQSLLRLAQSNATSNVLCSNQGGAKWSVYLESSTQIKLRCGPNGTENTQKILSLTDVELAGGASCTISPPYNIIYAPLNGKVTMLPDTVCSRIIINLKSTKDNTQQKSFSINKGGAVNVE